MLGIPMEYLLIASAMVPIGSIMISKIISPQTEHVKSITDVKMDNKGNNTNVIDAMAEGANTGMQMVISIGASIVGFVGIVAVVNLILGVFHVKPCSDILICICTIWIFYGTGYAECFV